MLITIPEIYYNLSLSIYQLIEKQPESLLAQNHSHKYTKYFKIRRIQVKPGTRINTSKNQEDTSICWKMGESFKGGYKEYLTSQTRERRIPLSCTK